MPDLVPVPVLPKRKAIGAGAGVRVRVKDGLAIASVLARAGKTDALVDQAQTGFGLALDGGPKRAAAGNASALGIGPGRWLFLQERADGEGDFLAALSASFKELASVSDHSDGYAVFEIGGPAMRMALAKGVPVDLHETGFGVDDVAVTAIAHIGAIVWREEPDRIVIAVFRSYAESFWHWLSASSAEYGLETV
jgi:methylglutamate dehydrogenase subunit D